MNPDKKGDSAVVFFRLSHTHPRTFECKDVYFQRKEFKWKYVWIHEGNFYLDTLKELFLANDLFEGWVFLLIFVLVVCWEGILTRTCVQFAGRGRNANAQVLWNNVCSW